jgi:hypothetical protein
LPEGVDQFDPFSSRGELSVMPIIGLGVTSI